MVFFSDASASCKEYGKWINCWLLEKQEASDSDDTDFPVLVEIIA